MNFGVCLLLLLQTGVYGSASYSAAYPANYPTPRTSPTPYASSYGYSNNYQPPSAYSTPTPRPYSPPTSSYSYAAPPTSSYAYVPPTNAYIPPTEAYRPPTRPYVPPTTAYVPPTPAYVPPTPAYVPPTNAYVPPTNAYGKGKGKGKGGKKGKAYVAPTPAYEPPTPAYPQARSAANSENNNYQNTSNSYDYNPGYLAPAPKIYSDSDQFTQSYYIPPPSPSTYTTPTTSTTYNSYDIPSQIQTYAPPPTPQPTTYSQPVDQSAMCSESAVGCYQGHIRLCVPGQRQANAKILRRCAVGCMSCPSGVPDVCRNDRYSDDICNTLATAHRPDRTCTRQQEGQVGCLGGPDIGYCSFGKVVPVDYCGSSGCVGNPVRDQCWPLTPTLPPTSAVVIPPSTNICDGNFIFCHNGHIRLCLAQQPKDFAAIIQDCRSQGCSSCPSGPDMCNDSDGKDVCSLPPQNQLITSCPAELATATYCDGSNVRNCDVSGRGILVEYCNNRGCRDSPPMCNPILPGDQQICNGSYVLCLGGHVKLCRDGLPMAQAQTLQDCRMQGCSNCPNAPAICNDENKQPLCAQMPPQSFVQPCSEGVPPMTTYCAGGSDVRHCDPSGRAFLVEYCQGTGCSANPPMCNPRNPNSPTPKLPSSPTPSTQCGPRVRREWGSMPDADRKKFIAAMQELYRRGECTRLAQFHFNNKERIHGTNNIHFFIWHRVIIFEIEELLRSIPGYECITLPYWNYQYSNSATARQDRRSPFGTSATKLGQGDNAGCIGGEFGFFQHTLDNPSPHCIKRAPTDLQNSLSCSLFVDLANIGEPTFLNFANNLQIAHGTPHVSFGDTFSTHFSPIDPLFWIHHANVDRIWDMWQDCHNDYWWYEPQAMNQAIVGYPGIVAGDFVDNSNVKWQGKSYSVSYASDDFQDPSLYSSDFRRNVATRCVGNTFRRYDAPMPILGVDDAWTKSLGGMGGIQFIARMSLLPDGTQALEEPPAVELQETGTFLQCVSQGMDNSHGPVVATYSDLSATECVTRCDKFFFKATGDSNCMCTSTTKRSTTRVSLNGTVTRTAYFFGCDGDPNQYNYFETNQQQSNNNGGGRRRRLLQQPLSSSARLRLDRGVSAAITSASSRITAAAAAAASSPTSSSLRDSVSSLRLDPAIVNFRLPRFDLPTAPSPATVSNLCFDPQVTTKLTAPQSCAAGGPKPVLTSAWLAMNGLAADAGDPCSKYKSPVGVQNVQCVNA